MFRGIFPPTVTLFKDDGAIDTEANQKHHDFLIESGVNGLFILATTGEFMHMNLKDREQHAAAVLGRHLGRLAPLDAVDERRQLGGVSRGVARLEVGHGLSPQVESAPERSTCSSGLTTLPWLLDIRLPSGPRTSPWLNKRLNGSRKSTRPRSFRTRVKKRLYSRCMTACSAPPMYWSTGSQYLTLSMSNGPCSNPGEV